MNRVKKKLVSLVRNLFKEDGLSSCAEEAPIMEATPPTKEEVSIEICKEDTVSQQSEDEELDRLEELLKRALFGKEEKQEKAPTTYILNSSEDQWYYNPNTRSMIRIPGGAQLIVSDSTPDDNDKVLCYCDFGFILVPMEEITPLGCN